MALNSVKFRSTYDALLNAFDEASLRLMVRVELDKDLYVIAGGKNFSEIVQSLIEWADRTDHVDDLVRGALSQNPGNARLRQLVLGLGDVRHTSPDTRQSQSTPPSISAGTYIAGNVSTDGGDFIGHDKINKGDEIHGDKVLGDKITIYIDDSVTIRSVVVDRRALEIAYLDGVIAEQDARARVYTPLEGIVETEQATDSSSSLKTQTLIMHPEFEHLVKRGTGVVERVPVPDLRDAVREYRRVVILGEPGSGKTTTLRRLAFDYAETAKHDDNAPLPVYVPLGGYQGVEDALSYIAAQLGDLAPYLRQYLNQRRIVLLLDALDEMPRHDYAQRVGRIRSLLDSQTDISVIVTCRSLNYIETLRLEKLNIKPLSIDQQSSYVRQYLGDEGGEKLFWQLVGGRDISECWQAWQEASGTWKQFWGIEETPDQIRGRIDSRLREVWRELRRKPLPGLLELGANPYMLRMFVFVFSEEGEVPQNRGMLFQRFVVTLLAREERRYDASAWPGSEHICQGLAELACAMQKSGKRGTAIDRAWAAEQIHALPAPELLHLAASANLLDVSNNNVRFVHQLLQEYFAALALSQNLANVDLASYCPSGWTERSGWEETVILLCGILPDLTDFVHKLQSVHPSLAARCVVESGANKPPKATIDAIQTKLVGIATSRVAPLKERLAAGNALNYLEDPRSGVGVRDDWLPDIEWCTVPAGVVISGGMHGRPVQLGEFLISKYPITNAQFQCFVTDGGYTSRYERCWTDAGKQWKVGRKLPQKLAGDFDLPNHPITGVIWHEAIAFCNWISLKLERRIMLPSLAEWQMAVRGPTSQRYPWDGTIDSDCANYNYLWRLEELAAVIDLTGVIPEISDDELDLDWTVECTTPVGLFPKGESSYGLLDAAGNVREWVHSEPVSRKEEEGYIPMGGSWYDLPRMLSTFMAPPHNGQSDYSDCGFRIVMYPDA